MNVKLRPAAALLLAALALTTIPASAGVKNGNMMAYYDDQLFTINFMELPPGGEAAVLTHNGSVNTIYMCDQCMTGPNPFMFISVLDAIQGDGFNPLWNEVQIVFNAGVTPHQFTSDNDILAAFKAGKITLSQTPEVYRCSVLGPGPK
jgi:hypothetical protein